MMCHANGMCDSATNSCKCKPNYYGDGINSCTVATCATTTIVGITYPGVNAGQTSTGNCPTGFKGTATRTCVQSTGCGATGCTTGTFPDSTLVYGCTQLMCQPPAGIEYNARYTTAVGVGGVMVGTCDTATGYSGTIFRDCVQVGAGAGATALLQPPSTACTVVTCPATNGEDSNWPATATGGIDRVVQSTCNAGYQQAAGGPPTRTCLANGQWATTIANPCIKVQCPAISEDDATGRAGFSAITWSATPVAGTCPPHYDVSGASPTRVCTQTGEWTPEANSCVRIRCPALPSDFATGAAGYAATDAPQTSVAGTCPAGWIGSPTRDCTLTGKTAAWTDAAPTECTRLECPPLDDDADASWPLALSGTPDVEGACHIGFVQSPKPRRACQLDGTWSSAIINSCQVAYCPTGSYHDASWPKTFPGESGFGNCSLGYRVADAGPPERQCFMNGTWDTEVRNECVRRTCPALLEEYADWPLTEATTATSGDMVVFGTCIAGFQGNPSRVCASFGNWSEITGACIPIECIGQPDCVINCTARVEFNAVWPESLSFTQVNGTCVDGWAGHPQRECGEYGAWQAPTAACTQLSCPPLNDGTATWDTELSGTAAVPGRCALGYATAGGGNGTDTSPPLRNCTTNCDGTACEWAEPENPCLRLHCPALASFQFAAFPETPSGTTANGTCVPGYQGTPSRVCNWDGTWGTVLSTCTQIFCPSSTSSDEFNDPTAFWGPVAAGSADVEGACKSLYGPVEPGVLPRRNCTLEGRWSATIEDACVRLTCPAVEENLASFPLSLAGTAQVFGACPPGYAGAPQRACSDLGVWGDVTGACVRRVCPGEADFFASWPNSTLSNETAIGTCQPGYAPSATAGAPVRLCQLDGTWSASLVAGTCEQLFCQELQEADAIWPRSPAGTPVQGTCAETFAGTVQRTCDYGATWGNITGTCTPQYCPAEANVNNTAFPATRAGTTAVGTCLHAFEAGTPIRDCNSVGQWQPIRNPCQRVASTCAADFNFKNAIWPETPAGSVSTGSCLPGFASADVPRRPCLRVDDDEAPYGLWENVSISDPCLFRPGPDSDTVRLTNVTVVAVTWNSVTLGWEAVSGATLFTVYYGWDNSTFFQTGAPIPEGALFQQSGLAEFTEYQFRIVPGQEGAPDTNGYGLSVRTYIKPPSNVRVTSYGDTAITVAWAPGSNYTSFVRIVYTTDGDDAGVGRRDAGTANDTEWHVAVNATNGTSYRIEGLTPATSYLFRIYAGMEDGTLEGVGTTIPVRTEASAFIDDSGKTSTSALAGSVTGVLVLLVLVVILGYVAYRRQIAKKQKELLAEYNSQVSMLTIPRTVSSVVDMGTFFDSDTLRRNALRANLNVPVTQFAGENRTMLNTVAELALPGYLLMDYSTALRPEARLVAGGAGTLFRATILDEGVVARSGTAECAVKVVEDWPSFTEEQNRERFHHEVTIMWSLSFNPNVIKLFGYCEQPRAIVTKLYPTDLFRYLHAQEDRNPLEPHLMLHLVSGIVNATAAMHSLGVAHRDIKSPNILMQEPQNGSVFPDPIICDFGISRTRYDHARAPAPRVS